MNNKLKSKKIKLKFYTMEDKTISFKAIKTGKKLKSKKVSKSKKIDTNRRMYQMGMKCENDAWLNGRRCHQCGKDKELSRTSDMCKKCWQEA